MPDDALAERLARVRASCDCVCESIEEKYELGDELGQGRFSVVHVATCKRTRERFAAKVIECGTFADEDEDGGGGEGEEAVDAFEVEVRILRRLNHPYVVLLREVVYCADAVYIMIELLEGGELFTRVAEHGALPEAEAKRLFARIALATEHLHALGVAHRDLKPENIMFSSARGSELKLIDFGYAGELLQPAELQPAGAAAGAQGAGLGLRAPAKRAGAAPPPEPRAPTGGAQQQRVPLTGLCGTPDYVAPEVLSWYEGDDGTPYDERADVWSLGVLLYVMLAGAAPFSAEDEDELLRLVGAAEYEMGGHEWEGVSEEAKGLVRALIVREPDGRLPIAEVLSHPWCAAAVSEARDAAAPTPQPSPVPRRAGSLAAHAAHAPDAAAAPPAPKPGLGADEAVRVEHELRDIFERWHIPAGAQEELRQLLGRSAPDAALANGTA